MDKIKLIALIISILTILSAGCINNPPPKEITATSTPTVTITPTPVYETPTAPLYEIPSGYEYGTIQGSELYSNRIDKQFVRIEAIVFGEGGEYYNNQSKRKERYFQIYGKYDNDLNAIYVTSFIDKIDGNIKQDSEVLIYGYFDNNLWFEGSNIYGTTIRQPRIFAHNVTVIPEIQLQRWVWDGKGNFKTPRFHINTSEWVIFWSDELSDLPGGFNFEIIVYDSSNRIIKTVKGYREGTDSGTQGVKGPGEFYLEIKTGMKYNVSVIERAG